MKPTVAAVIPTFNRAELTIRALRSVYAQSRLPDEVIVVDDGSTDSTVSDIRRTFPDCVVLTQTNSGVSVARNTAIEHSSSDWIALLDSDDEWLPKKLEGQLEAVVRSPDYKVCHTEEIWIRNGVRVNQMKKHQKAGGDIFERSLPLCAMSPSSILIHRSVFRDVGLFDPELPACEDYDLWLRITAAMPVLFIETPLIKKYGGHDDQLSRKFWGMDRFRLRSLERLVDQGELSEKQRAAAVKTLISKLRIFGSGAKKRERYDELEEIALKMRRYEHLLSELQLIQDSSG